jgi:hypothetical protein
LVCVSDDIEDEEGLFTNAEGPLHKRQRMYTPGIMATGIEKKGDDDDDDDNDGLDDELDAPDNNDNKQTSTMGGVTEDELERAMYGQSEPSTSHRRKKKDRPSGPASSYVFTVRDKLLNFAPIADFAMGTAPKQGDVSCPFIFRLHQSCFFLVSSMLLMM